MCALGYDRDFVRITMTLRQRKMRTDCSGHILGWRVVTLTGALIFPQESSRPAPPGRALAPTGGGSRVRGGPVAGVLVSLGGDIRGLTSRLRAGWPVLVADDHRYIQRADLAEPRPACPHHRRGPRHIFDQPLRWRRGQSVDGITFDPRTGRGLEPGPGAQSASQLPAARGERRDGCHRVRPRRRGVVAKGLPVRLVSADGTVPRINRWPAAGTAAPCRYSTR